MASKLLSTSVASFFCFSFAHILRFASCCRGYISCEAATKRQRPFVWAVHHCARSATRLAVFLIISISVCRVMPLPSPSMVTMVIPFRPPEPGTPP
ncbi:hypothetical protein V8C42DRAFT_319535 [Trichoderma barbatum]